MKLSNFEGETVRILLKNADVFEGVCTVNPAEYGMLVMNREEESLEIDNWMFFKSEICRVEVLDRAPAVWMNRPLHCMHLATAPFRAIESGSKTIELRLNDEKRKKIRVRDIIRFEDAADTAEVLFAEVIALHPFPSFDALYQALPAAALGYPAGAEADPHDMDAYYSAAQQAACGVLGIEIKLI